MVTTPSISSVNTNISQPLYCEASQPSSYLPSFSNNKKILNITEPKARQIKQATATLLSNLSGMNIKLAGRILSQKLKRRVKSKSIQKGTLARTKANIVNTSRFTNKNKIGAFSITIKTGHLIVK